MRYQLVIEEGDEDLSLLESPSGDELGICSLGRSS